MGLLGIPVNHGWGSGGCNASDGSKGEQVSSLFVAQLFAVDGPGRVRRCTLPLDMCRIGMGYAAGWDAVMHIRSMGMSY